MMNWNNIDSSPEDGTHILGYSTMGRVYIISFNGKWHNMPKVDFTHWMPLPELPMELYDKIVQLKAGVAKALPCYLRAGNN